MGAEPALKEEIARTASDLRFAYSRPGFVTFKKDQEPGLGPSHELKSIFARAYGISLGKFTAKAAAGKAPAETALEFAQAVHQDSGKKLRLHVWERDRHVLGEEPLGFERGALSRPALQEIQKLDLGAVFHADPRPQPGDLVFDVVVVEGDEWWFGVHEHSLFHSPFPGGQIQLELPAEAPSRAFLKIEEAIRWSGARLQKGDIAVEIGSAPGGASFALVQRGVKVVGIDPGVMDPRLLNSPDFQHIQKPVASVLREDLPSSVQWLLLDMNSAPSLTLYQVDRLASRMKESLLGMFLTLKLNDWGVAKEIPSILAHIQAIGMVRVRARQLFHNRQEILVFGCTRKGQSRIS